jgi:hypothetical protein
MMGITMKDEGGRMNAERQSTRHAPWRPLRGIVVFVCFSSFILHPSSFASAAPSQAEVFQSIQTNVGQRSENNAKGLAILLCAAASLILVMLAGSKIRRRQSTPQPLHHPGKLLREVLKTVPLRPKELKQLKLLADASRQEGSRGEPVQNPLTLLLCPSVLARSLRNHPATVDRAVLAQVVRKMGVAGK